MNPFLAQCRASFEAQATQEGAVEGSQRQAEWTRFEALGWPTKRLEDWKYTALSGLEKLSLHHSIEPREAVKGAPRALLEGIPAPRLVFVDGMFQPDQSMIEGLPKGVHLRFWSELDARERERFTQKMAPARALTAFGALNGALFTEGIWITVDAGCALETPLHLVKVSLTGQRMSHGALLLESEENSELTLREHCLGSTDQPAHSNWVTAIELAPQARLTLVKVQQEGLLSYHTAALYGLQRAGSQLQVFAFALSGALGRNDITLRLIEPHAECVLKGMYRVADRALQDFHTTIEHDSPHCTSEECFKGVLEGSGKAVFNGRVRVALDAQKTSSRQSNHNLLLSDKAEVNTKPQLEIFADDVKCSHGTTVGQLDEEQWFYLRTRGIAADLARTLLIQAFTLEIAEAIPHVDVRAEVRRLLGGTVEENGHV
ncbi:MAG: Fe-S cluster assembly protein SufD [Ferrovum myxofaciens]|uniref:Fe-S cluster assembly protein SufD n=1 Tax=Ferrovum myxofaciens TaxID=416213 RepID=UPI00235707F3|nr:Fe-S cluster assembly protein SufD [Ferrovum myxofaciens]QKE41266.1 MAG: Fe-S cluster assembly protein SufD [Ferrovum myxofaciens]